MMIMVQNGLAKKLLWQKSLSQDCRDWESEGQGAEALGIRYVALRIGLVLSRNAGFLPKTTMTLPSDAQLLWQWTTLLCVDS